MHYCDVCGRSQRVLQDAAREKAAAGEGRNVEHVAEADDMTHAAADTKKRKKTSSKPKTEQPALLESNKATKRSRRRIVK